MPNRQPQRVRPHSNNSQGTIGLRAGLAAGGCPKRQRTRGTSRASELTAGNTENASLPHD